MTTTPRRNVQDTLQAILDRLDTIDQRLDGIENDVRAVKVIMQIDEQVANLRRIGVTDVLARTPSESSP